MQRKRQQPPPSDTNGKHDGDAGDPEAVADTAVWNWKLVAVLVMAIFVVGCAAAGLWLVRQAGLPRGTRGSAQEERLEPAVPSPGPWQRLYDLQQDDLPTAQDLEWRVASQEPRIYVMDNFLSQEECEFLKAQVAGRLEPAKVVQKSENKWDTQTQVRNNEQIWLTQGEELNTPLLRHVLKRMHRAARVPDDDAEALQIGHYGVGQKYELHLDTDPTNDVPRPATLLIYLGAAEEGGETIFPLTAEGRRACSPKWHEQPDGSKLYGIQNCCSRDLPGSVKIPSKVGRAVLFWNHDTAGRKDSRADHAACPVKKGEKWVAQRWFRFKPYQMLVHPSDWRFDGLPVAKPHASYHERPEVLPGWLDVRILSQKAPRVYMIENFLSAEECQHLIALAQRLEPFHEGGVARRWVPPEVESSDEIVSAIVKRMHRTAMVPERHAESLQLGRYEPGGSMAFHLDTAPEHKLVRPATIIVYLDGDGGLEDQTHGATVFPLRQCQELDECCELIRHDATVTGGSPLVVPPKAGRALLFGSHGLDGKLDRTSAHGACAAGPRGKWIAQRWFRTEVQNSVIHKRDARFDSPDWLRP